MFERQKGNKEPVEGCLCMNLIKGVNDIKLMIWWLKFESKEQKQEEIL